MSMAHYLLRLDQIGQARESLAASAAAPSPPRAQASFHKRELVPPGTSPAVSARTGDRIGLDTGDAVRLRPRQWRSGSGTATFPVGKRRVELRQNRGPFALVLGSLSVLGVP